MECERLTAQQSGLDLAVGGEDAGAAQQQKMFTHPTSRQISIRTGRAGMKEL
jgi:hypothetical protein